MYLRTKNNQVFAFKNVITVIPVEHLFIRLDKTIFLMIMKRVKHNILPLPPG